MSTRVHCDGDEDEEGRATIALPVLFQGEPLAWLWAVEHTPPQEPTAAERSLLERAAVVIALIITRQRIVQEVTWRDARELLNDLILRGDAADTPALFERGLQLGVNLSSKHVLIVARAVPAKSRALDTDRPRTSSQSARPTRANMSRCMAVLGDLPDTAIMTGLGSETIILHGVDDEAVQPEDLAKALERQARPPGAVEWHVAISPTCTNVSEYPRAYEATRRALDLAARGSGFGSIIDVRQLGVFGVLLEVADSQRIREFASEMLAPILSHDVERGGELIATLRAYLEFGCSPAEAAKQLFVHTNTIRYRVQRVEQLMGRSLASSTVRLELTLALMITDLVGDPPVDVDPDQRPDERMSRQVG